jgi:hypothetical protein
MDRAFWFRGLLSFVDAYHPDLTLNLSRECFPYMKTDSLDYQPQHSEVGVYDCEVFLKFRLIEDSSLLSDRERLLEVLLDAFSYGPDEFLEPIKVKVDAEEVDEVDVSPMMRRQLIRLRNSGH